MFEELRNALLEKIEFWEEERDIRDIDVRDFSEYKLKEALEDSTSFKLYRYSPPTYYSIRNVETQTIHLSENGVMNDVFEGLPETLDTKAYSQAKKLNDLAHMTCFSEENKNLLMWSHYADSHKGFCVEYNLKKLVPEDDRFNVIQHIYPVVYREHRSMHRDLTSLVESHRMLCDAIRDGNTYDGLEELDDIIPLFLTKSTDWSYEKEWRILFTKKEMYDVNEDELYSLNIHFKCVSAIYLGYRIDPEIRRNMVEISSRLSLINGFVPVYQATLAPSGYDIVFKKIN